MSNCLDKTNNCEIPILAWTIAYYYKQKKHWYTEVVDKVPASQTMLYYFIYVTLSHRHAFQMSGNIQISVHTNINPSFGTSDM